MKTKTKKIIKLLLITAIILVATFFIVLNTSPKAVYVSYPLSTSTKKSVAENPPNYVNLPVPFTAEAPDGLMIKPWNNSCEEASLVMLDEFYSGNRDTTINNTAAKQEILAYIAIENKIFGYNANTNAAEMTRLANTYSKYFTAKVVTNPTLTQIKTELAAGRPVIALVYGFDLHNPRIDFLVGGSYYHTFVIKGFDDNRNEFIVNDDGDLTKGLDLRYSYDTILGALRDYSHKTGETVKPATVLFTSQKTR